MLSKIILKLFFKDQEDLLSGPDIEFFRARFLAIADECGFDAELARKAKIELVPEKELPEGALGRCLHSVGAIQICRDLDEIEMEYALYHELLHACLGDQHDEDADSIFSAYLPGKIEAPEEMLRAFFVTRTLRKV